MKISDSLGAPIGFYSETGTTLSAASKTLSDYPSFVLCLSFCQRSIGFGLKAIQLVTLAMQTSCFSSPTNNQLDMLVPTRNFQFSGMDPSIHALDSARL